MRSPKRAKNKRTKQYLKRKESVFDLLSAQGNIDDDEDNLFIAKEQMPTKKEEITLQKSSTCLIL